ncbi:MAG: phosphoadenosine phosphosulfate reductase family protein, partial [Pyrobaculum sp.]
RVLKERFPQGYISVVGQRGAESFLRAKLPRVSQSRWVVGSLVAAPIQEWTALEVWLYIYLHRLPYNPAYVRGFDRLGCVICPANEMAELAAVEKNYPKIFERIEKAARREMSRVDWELGLWRWRKKTPGDVVKWTKKSREGRLPARLTKTQEGLQVELDVEPHLETFREFLKMLKPAVEIRQVGGRWLVNTGDERLALDAAGLLVRAAICGDCDLCVYWCPTGALKRVGPGRSFRVDAERCVGCLLCSSVCPSAQYLVYRNEA